ncbi:hypothetical protein M758_4G080200, partial [Ceratodon purpureus]
MVALAHVKSNVRLAAAEAIAAGMYEFPATVAVGLSSLLSFLPLLTDIFKTHNSTNEPPTSSRTTMGTRFRVMLVVLAFRNFLPAVMERRARIELRSRILFILFSAEERGFVLFPWGCGSFECCDYWIGVLWRPWRK